MKHLAKITAALTLAITLTACATPIEKTESLLLPFEGQNNYVHNAASDSVYLNLTSIGLYNGERGTKIANSNIEFGVALNGVKTGDALPDTVITSSTPDVSFHKWCYYQEGGMLQYTMTIVEGVSLYQAVFKYEGDYASSSSTITSSTTTSSDPITTSKPNETSSTPTTSNPGSDTSTSIEEPTDTVRYYFIDSSWWNKDAAESWIYLWNSTLEESWKVAWPGEMMTHQTWDEESMTNVWHFDIDLELYDRAIISRRKTDTVTGDVADWGAQTVDIELNADFNTITLGSDPAWNGAGNKASVTTSLETY